MLSPDSSQEKLQQKITTKIYQSSAEEILDFFGVDPELGRLDNEIPQLLAYYGYNRFKEEQKKS